VAEHRVNAAYCGSSSWVSVSGTAEIIRDQLKARELWNPFVEAWLPEGPQDPNIVLIRVQADTAEYWDSPGGRVGHCVESGENQAHRETLRRWRQRHRSAVAGGAGPGAALRRQQPGRLGGGQDLVGYALPCGEDQWPDPVTLGHPHRC